MTAGPVPTAIPIAQAANREPVSNSAPALGLRHDAVERYGKPGHPDGTIDERLV